MTICDQVYVGLGSNLGDPAGQVRKGIQALAEIEKSRLLHASSLYLTEPVGDIQQPDFVNAVVQLETALSPLELLAVLKNIENRLGRTRDGTHWGPRVIDLDLLLFGEAQLSLPELILPHPELGARLFVLLPLQEIAPALRVSGLGAISRLINQAPALRVERFLPG